jgi:hypothetical protein
MPANDRKNRLQQAIRDCAAGGAPELGTVRELRQ